MEKSLKNYNNNNNYLGKTKNKKTCKTMPEKIIVKS